MFRSLRTRAAWIVAAVVLAATIVGASPAQAATGGGCGAVYYHTWGYHYACISATTWGRAIADGYVQVYSNHPSVSISVQAVTPNGTVISGNESGVSSGAVFFRIASPEFARTSGSYRSVVNFRYFNPSQNHNAFSPYLNLP
jgi:hypothetical protein